MTIKNPILPGFYPDPSICRAGNKYYLVNSTFDYFPGLPVFESENLCEWVQIGNAIDRESQLDFSNAYMTRGLFAPTIRYNKGKFYIICTQVDKLGNFFISADNPAGPWSDPIKIEGAEGIDPSLFFDDDGTVWYIGTRPAPEGPKWNGNWEIWVQRIDLATGKLYGKDTGIWRGALKRCIWPEGPHIYKIDGKTNAEIQQLLEAEFGIKHSEEYISSLWRNKIPKLIATQAQEDFIISEFKKLGLPFKKCSKCGQKKPAHNHFFSINKTSKDGWYSICKSCRNKKKE